MRHRRQFADRGTLRGIVDRESAQEKLRARARPRQPEREAPPAGRRIALLTSRHREAPRRQAQTTSAVPAPAPAPAGGSGGLSDVLFGRPVTWWPPRRMIGRRKSAARSVGSARAADSTRMFGVCWDAGAVPGRAFGAMLGSTTCSPSSFRELRATRGESHDEACVQFVAVVRCCWLRGAGRCPDLPRRGRG